MAAGSERREIPMLIYAHFKFHASRMYTQESILQTISTPIPTYNYQDWAKIFLFVFEIPIKTSHGQNYIASIILKSTSTCRKADALTTLLCYSVIPKINQKHDNTVNGYWKFILNHSILQAPCLYSRWALVLELLGDHPPPEKWVFLHPFKTYIKSPSRICSTAHIKLNRTVNLTCIFHKILRNHLLEKENYFLFNFTKSI